MRLEGIACPLKQAELRVDASDARVASAPSPGGPERLHNPVEGIDGHRPISTYAE